MQEFRIRNLGPFMGKLFSSDCFDSFLVESGTIRTSISWDLEGKLNRGFYTSEEWDNKELRPYELAAYQDIRLLLRELIKGKKAPVYLRLVLSLKPDFTGKTLLAGGADDALAGAVSSLKITVRYDGSSAGIITGVAYRTFTMDKTAEEIWDRTMAKFLAIRGIDCDQ